MACAINSNLCFLDNPPGFGQPIREVKILLTSYLRTILLYFILLGAIRCMGKRQIGQMEASEFVVAMLVADLAAIPMQDVAIPLYTGLVPILTVLGRS